MSSRTLTKPGRQPADQTCAQPGRSHAVGAVAQDPSHCKGGRHDPRRPAEHRTQLSSSPRKLQTAVSLEFPWSPLRGTATAGEKRREEPGIQTTAGRVPDGDRGLRTVTEASHARMVSSTPGHRAQVLLLTTATAMLLSQVIPLLTPQPHKAPCHNATLTSPAIPTCPTPAPCPPGQALHHPHLAHLVWVNVLECCSPEPLPVRGLTVGPGPPSGTGQEQALLTDSTSCMRDSGGALPSAAPHPPRGMGERGPSPPKGYGGSAIHMATWLPRGHTSPVMASGASSGVSQPLPRAPLQRPVSQHHHCLQHPILHEMQGLLGRVLSCFSSGPAAPGAIPRPGSKGEDGRGEQLGHCRQPSPAHSSAGQAPPGAPAAAQRGFPDHCSPEPATLTATLSAGNPAQVVAVSHWVIATFSSSHVKAKEDVKLILRIYFI